MVDIRIPIGLMFSIVGVLITGIRFVHNIKHRDVSEVAGYQC